MIGPRPTGAPRGRAVLGGLLIAAAAVLVFATALSSRHRSASYVVASRPLTAGTIIGPGDTATESIDLPAATRSGAFDHGALLIGRRLDVAVSPGELLQSSMLASGTGARTLRPVSIPVDSASLAGMSPGIPVDVLATPSSSGSVASGAAASSGAGAGGAVTVVLRGATLLSISRPGSALAPVSSSGTVVTLGVTSLGEAEMLVEAAHTATVVLVQATPSDGVGPGAGS